MSDFTVFLAHFTQVVQLCLADHVTVVRLRTHSGCPKIVPEGAEFVPLPLLGCRLWGCPARTSGGCPDSCAPALCSEQVKLHLANAPAASHGALILKEEHRAGWVVSRNSWRVEMVVSSICRGTVHPETGPGHQRASGMSVTFINCVCESVRPILHGCR